MFQLVSTHFTLNYGFSVQRFPPPPTTSVTSRELSLFSLLNCNCRMYVIQATMQVGLTVTVCLQLINHGRLILRTTAWVRLLCVEVKCKARDGFLYRDIFLFCCAYSRTSYIHIIRLEIIRKASIILPPDFPIFKVNQHLSWPIRLICPTAAKPPYTQPTLLPFQQQWLPWDFASSRAEFLVLACGRTTTLFAQHSWVAHSA